MRNYNFFYAVIIYVSKFDVAAQRKLSYLLDLVLFFCNNMYKRHPSGRRKSKDQKILAYITFPHL